MLFIFFSVQACRERNLKTKSTELATRFDDQILCCEKRSLYLLVFLALQIAERVVGANMRRYSHLASLPPLQGQPSAKSQRCR